MDSLCGVKFLLKILNILIQYVFYKVKFHILINKWTVYDFYKIENNSKNSENYFATFLGYDLSVVKF